MSWDSTAGLIKTALPSPFTASTQILNFSSGTDTIPVVIPSIAITVSAPLAIAQSGPVTTLSGSPVQINVSVSDFSIAANFDKVINGATIHIAVNAQCTGAKLTLANGSLNAGIQWLNKNDFVDLSVGEVNLAWNAADWTISGPQCQGLSGLDAVTQNLLLAALADPNAFAPQIKTALQNEINLRVATVKGSIENMVQRRVLQVPIAYQLIGLAGMNSAGLVFQVQAGFDAASLSSAPMDASILSAVDWSLVPSLSLIVQSSNVEFLINGVFSKGSYALDMNTLPAFENLLSSWIEKLFVWPDLLSYSRTSPFQLLSQAINQNMRVQLGTNMSLTIQGEVGSWLMSEKDGRRWPYIYAASKLKSAGVFALNGTDVQVKFSNPTLSQSFTFGPDYVERYQPIENFPKSIIQAAVLKQLETQSLQLPLPSFGFPGAGGGATTFSVQSIRQMGSLCVFTLGPAL